MQINGSLNYQQTYGTSPGAATTTTANVRTSAATEDAPRVTQRVDAAPPADATARPEADARSPVSANADSTRPGSRVNVLV